MASRAGVPVTAVKYYQREGLLHEGDRKSPTQVRYDDSHVQRVRLVRALIETGGLSVAATREVIRVLDDPDARIDEAFGVAQHSMSTPRTPESDPSEASQRRVESLALERGWRFTADNPGLRIVSRALDGLLAIGFDPPQRYLDAYADAAERAAAADLMALTQREGDEAVIELMVIGTVLGDPLFAGLRRIAHEDATGKTFHPADSGEER